MTRPPGAPSSLYQLLAMRPPIGTPAGETLNTRRKETIDADVEALELEPVASVYELFATDAPMEAVAGETTVTKKIETIDEEPNDHSNWII